MQVSRPGWAVRRGSIVARGACVLALAALPVTSHAQAPTFAFGGYRLDVWQPGGVVGSALPANNINFLAQSADGYLWLATSAGLARFDGLRFDLFTPANTPAFKGRLSYILWPMDMARGDTLWIATDRGMIPYLNREFGIAPIDTTLEGEAVQQLATDAHGALYGVTVRGSVFELVNGRYVRVPLPGVPRSDGYGIVADSDGTLWMAKDRSGLVRLRDGVVTRWLARDGLGDDRVSSVFRSRDGSLWIGTQHGAVRFANGEFSRVDFWGGRAQHQVFATAQTADGALWFASDGGGIVRVEAKGKGGYVATRFTKKEGLTDDRAISILADREGNVWVGTRLGLNRFHPVPFQAITTRDGLPSDAMGAILRDDDGRLWLAPAAGGLYQGRVVDGRIRSRIVESPTRGRATTLANGHRGLVWAGWDRGGATAYHPPDAPMTIGAAHEIAPGTVYAVHRDPNGALWLAARGGVTRLVNPSGEQTGDVHTKIFTARDGLQEDVSMRFFQDATGAMWVGNAALSRIVGDSVHTYRVADGLAAPMVTAILGDSDGTLWVGTHGGLTRVRSGRLVALRGEQGLTDEYVNAIEADDYGHLWLAGAQGLTQYSRVDLDSSADAAAQGRTRRLTSAVTFGSADGLPGRDAVLDASPGSFRSPDGKLWFAMAWGIAVVDPSRLPKDTLRPYVHIESVVADGQSMTMVHSLEIPAETRRVEVRYTGVSLSDGTGVRMRYRLEGLDTTWVDAGAQRTASFTHLSPGRYTLRVAARTARGAWGGAESALRFRVLPAYYQQWWFIALCLALAIALVWAVIMYRHRELESRMNAVIEERTRMARELHDTLLQGFTGIALQLRAIGARRQHALKSGSTPTQTDVREEESTHAIDALVAIAESTLSEARHAVWDMRAPPPRPLAPGAHALVDQLEHSAREVIGRAPIALDFSVAGDRRPLTANVEEELGRIAREAIANAVRHGEPKRIVVSLVYEPSGVRLMVRDDGHGFDTGAPVAESPPRSGRGHFGLIGMRERAERLGARITIASELERGTTVLVALPKA
jgi:signal transduction histidine kinase/ligand-binding sensor domain-containing protein